MKKQVLFNILIGVILSITLIIALSDISVNALSFSSEKVFNFIGIIVSSFALVIGVYFALLAISAYSHIKNIQGIEVKINEIYRQWNTNVKLAEKFISDYAKEVYNEVDEQISLDEYYYKMLPKDDEMLDKIVKRRELLRLKRARLSYRYPVLDFDLRKKLLLELANIGTTEDIPEIRKLMEDEQEINEIKKIAVTVLNLLIEKSTLPNMQYSQKGF